MFLGLSPRGSERWFPPGGGDRPAGYRFRRILARPGPLSGNRGDRDGGATQASLPGPAPRGRPMAGGPPPHQGHRPRHRQYRFRSVQIFKNVARIGELPPKDFTILALPMKIKGGSGGPLRILARLDP